MIKIQRFSIPKNCRLERLLQEVGKTYKIDQGGSSEARFTYYDTVDLLIRRAGFVLMQCEDWWQLQDLARSKEPLLCPLFNARGPLFATSFRDEQFRLWLINKVDVRMLRPVAITDNSSELYHCLNEDEKTVIRFQVEVRKSVEESSRKSTDHILEVRPLRGYVKDAKRLTQILRKSKCRRLLQDELKIKKFATPEGIQALKYSAIMCPPLTDIDRLLDALINKLSYTRKVVLANIDGIRDGRDTECLHDFRVAIRQLRSALSQIEDVFSPEFSLSLKQDFSYLSKSTNKMRDLDVYYLAHDQFKALVPEVLHRGLLQFHRHLGRLRRRELNSVRAWLDGPNFAMIMKRLKKTVRTLRSRDELHSRAAGFPVKPVLSDLILRRYRKILRAGNQIVDGSPDEELHNLRLQIKKMRYLIEFSEGLFTGSEIDYFKKRFRRLQNTLGRFNDESVHMEKLRLYLTDISGPKVDGDFSAAMGGLITALREQHLNTRKEFRGGFKCINNPKTVKRAKALFKNPS